MRWGLFQTSEYINLITLSGPDGDALLLRLARAWGLGPIWFLLKLFALLFVFIWIRTTVPRLRYDQLMKFGWKILLPVATINAVITALFVVAFDAPARRTLKGFGVTFKQIFKKPITQQYPEFKRPIYPRFRGRHRSGRTRTGSRSASAARSAPPRARPTASASFPPRTRRTTASRPASATRASTRST